MSILILSENRKGIMNSVLFVCAANICRSPMAMGLLRGKIQAEPGQWRIESVGVWATPGYQAASNTQLVLEERGLDVSAHRSKQISKEIISQFNLVLVMERGQKEALRAAFPEFARRIYLLTEMIEETGDIADPIGGPLAEFRLTAREIDQILNQGLDRIRLLSGESAPLPQP
jgi:protein-tyrosine-phosphatase